MSEIVQNSRFIETSDEIPSVDELTKSIEEMRQQLREFELFEKCTAPADNSEDFLHVMELVRDYFAEKFVFDRLSVFIKLPNEKFCVMFDVVAQDDIVPFPAGTLMRLKESGVDFVMINKRTHYNPDIQSYKQFVDDEQLAHGGIRTLVRIPLVHNDKPFGVMSVNSIKEKHFSHGEVPFMELIAAWISRSAFPLSLTFETQTAAYKDMLTGSLNRSFLNDLTVAPKSGIVETIAGVSTDFPDVSLLFINVNRFKQFNDRFGYSEGDIRLARFVKLLQDAIGDDGFVTRFAGGRFFVVLPGKSKSEAERFRNEIELQALTFNSMYGDSAPERKPLSLNIKIGNGQWPELEKLMNSLVENNSQND